MLPVAKNLSNFKTKLMTGIYKLESDRITVKGQISLYQNMKGAICLCFDNLKPIKLTEEQLNTLPLNSLYELPYFDIDLFTKYYKP